MIEQAEAEETLVKGKIIIEPTSGNTGIGLAMIGVVKGYEVEIIMSKRELIKENPEKHFMPDQFSNKLLL